MAKKLQVGTYRFDASEKIVYIQGNVQPEKFLLITNITDNTIIYNFANPSLGFAGKSYNQSTDETEFNLIYDTTSMSDTDILQIFTDSDYQEITPSEDMLDPVGKMRVSNPENLIDTDFEYGLQSTKWETLQTVNNIPTIFSNSGDTPVDGIVSVDAVNGSKNVKVTTSLNHGLSIGDAVSVQGLSQYQAEGFFIVTSVPTTLTFFFELDVPANFSGDISGSYTTIIAGKFFEGSTLPVSTSDGAVTDGASPASNITVTTSDTHGFSTGTKVYLRNTVGPKVLKIADSTATAPDGRPFVDITPTFSNSVTVNQATDTGRGSFRSPALIPYDWESLWTTYLAPGDVNAGADTITWTSHSLRNGYTLLFNTPHYQLTDGGLVDGTVYYVEKIDDDTIKLHTSDALSAAVNLTTLNNSYGLARLGLVYKVEGASNTERYTEAYRANDPTTTVYSGDFQSGSTASVTNTINLSTLFGVTPTAVKIENIQLRGDVNATSEWVSFTIAGTSQQVYGPGNQSWNYGSTANLSGGSTAFDGLDVTSATYVSNGQTYIDIVSSCSTGVGTFTSPGNLYRYGFRINLTNTVSTTIGESQKQYSGGDLYDSQYGLGDVQPTRVLAFQSRDANTTGQNSEDGFSYLVNQRFAGRYGTIGGKYSNTVEVTASQSLTSSFTINYTDSTTDYATSSEYFYIWAKDLTSDRNTLFINNHGIEDGTTVTLTVDATRYSAGDRFAFASSTGAVTTITSNVLTATVAVVNQDVIRLTLNQTPNTDDIVEVPAIFSLAYNIDNRTYNTVFVNNHKITGDANAIYNNVTGNAIPPITDGQSVILKRVDDSRLEVTGNFGATSGTQTYVVEYNSNATQNNLFVDIETALGFTPTAATIDQIEYRGDFNFTSEYLDLTFSDGDSYRIGQFNGSDSSTYTVASTFSTKNISSILQTQGGKVGFVATYDPSNDINYGPGGGPWWGLRFTVTANASTIVMTGQGTGAHGFDVSNLVGAYDGVFNITSVPNANEFIMASDFQIPKRTYTFTSTNIDNAAETITFSSDHNLITGEKVTYSEGSNTSILPGGAANPLFVIVESSTIIRLASSFIDAQNNIGINITGQTGTHTITSENVIKSATSPGTVAITNGSKEVVGTGTNFIQRFKRFDKIYIDIGTYVKEFTVDGITTATNMTLFEAPTLTQPTANYYFATQLALRPDGFQLHKPFDGGVDITAGTSPNSRICRQTRKYFRYQSGKGIQTSFAINFNPPRIVRELIKATGPIATVTTQEQHNLSVGDNVTITGAEVNTGLNTYNGTFAVATTPNEFEFTYQMSSSPTDVKASGFPKYVRAGWTESFVRAGMFDDQNGMFFEYDGQKLYAVRRSSTLQLAGSVNVTRGSQVVTGSNTSFTTQLTVGNNVVIRGQTYKIVEVSSDIRLVVQPAYRGIDGTSVKITKTIDTRTAQENWNIDKADGTGFTGYIFDVTKIQMAYIDYSWYGAGKIRYGFKDRLGHIKYFHEYRHNNVLDESYFRSGNLPSRYEIENGANSTTAPTLFHFGTSVIMDGEFDDDKAYQFSGQSQPMSFANGTSNNYASTADTTFEQITIDGKRVFVYAFQVAAATAQAVEVGMPILHNSNTTLPSPDTYITQIIIDGANSKIFTSYPATLVDPTGGSTYPVIASGQTFDIGEPTITDLTQFLPLISCRLAPSVDSALTGVLGEREVLNRMQLRLRQASVTTNQPCEIFLIQNALPSALLYQTAQSPSLAQIIKHRVGDTLLNGTTIFAQKSPAGTTTVDLAQLLEIGNSILGGDGIYPAGPDLLTVAVQPQSTTGVTFADPLIVSGNLSWSESQA